MALYIGTNMNCLYLQQTIALFDTKLIIFDCFNHS